MEQPPPPAPLAQAQVKRVTSRPGASDAHEPYAEQLEGFRQALGLNNSSPTTAATSAGDASSLSKRLTEVRQNLSGVLKNGDDSKTADTAASERQLAGLAGWILGALSRGEDPKELAAFALGSQPFGRSFSGAEVRSELLAQLSVLAPQPRQELLDRLGAAGVFENVDSSSKGAPKDSTDSQVPPSDALVFCEALERGLEQLRGGFERLSNENSGLRSMLNKKSPGLGVSAQQSSPSKRAAETDDTETSVEALHNRLIELLERVTQRAEHSERLASLLDHSHEQLAQLPNFRIGSSLASALAPPPPPGEVRPAKVVRAVPMQAGQAPTQGIRVHPTVSAQAMRLTPLAPNAAGTSAQPVLTTQTRPGLVRCSSAPPLRQWRAPQPILATAPTHVASDCTGRPVSPVPGAARRVASPVGAGIRLVARGGMAPGITVTPRPRGADMQAGPWRMPTATIDPRNVANDFVAFANELVGPSQGSRVRSPERN